MLCCMSPLTGKSHSPNARGILHEESSWEDLSNQSYPMNNDPMAIDLQIQRFESRSKLLADFI